MINGNGRNGGNALDFGFLDSLLGLELRKAQRKAEKKFEQVFGKSLLPGHLTVLVLIENNPGVTQSAIASSAGLDRSSLVPLLKQFEKRGLIVREKASDDARSNVTRITPAGRKFIKKNAARVEQLEKTFHDALGEDGYQRLVGYLQKLQEST